MQEKLAELEKGQDQAAAVGSVTEEAKDAPMDESEETSDEDWDIGKEARAVMPRIVGAKKRVRKGAGTGRAGFHFQQKQTVWC